MRKQVLTALSAAGALTVLAAIGVWAQAANFDATPTWEGIKACSGQPIQSPSPKFVLKNVPAATVEIEFKMTDLDYPSFNHGSGKVRYAGAAEIAPGAFTFVGPCPPSTHRYEWTITARDAAGQRLATTRATKKYP